MAGGLLKYVVMTEGDFDTQLVRAAFAMGADVGWARVSAAGAARSAGLDLVQARARFASRVHILRKFGEQADVAALTGALSDGPVRDRLFDILLRRFDYLQAQRAGVVALLKYLPTDPPLALYLARASLRSMGWMLEGAGVSARGLRGQLATRGLLLVWAHGLRAWLRDETEDLSATMAAVDTALNRADALAQRFCAPGAATLNTTDAAFAEAEGPELPLPPDLSGIA